MKNYVFALKDGSEVTFNLSRQLTVRIVKFLGDGSASGIAYQAEEVPESGSTGTPPKKFFLKLAKLRTDRLINSNDPSLREAQELMSGQLASFQREVEYGAVLRDSPDFVPVLGCAMVAPAALDLVHPYSAWPKGDQDSLRTKLQSLQVPVCLQELAEEPDLREWLKSDSFRTPKEFFGFFWQLSEAVGKLHELGTIHNDIHEGNIKVKVQGEEENRQILPKLLDFGLSLSRVEADARLREPRKSHLFTSDLFPNTLIGDVESLGRLLLHVAINESWRAGGLGFEELKSLYLTIQTDRGKVREVLDRHANEMLRAHPMLADVIFRSVSVHLESRFKSTHEFSRFLKLVEVAGDGEPRDREVVKRIVKEIEVTERSAANSRGDLWRSFFAREMMRLRALYDDSNRGVFETYGGRDALIDTMCEVLSGLAEGWTYSSLSSVETWHSSNYGSGGRILGLFEQLLSRGVMVERVIYFDEDRLPSEGDPKAGKLAQTYKELVVRTIKAHQRLHESFPDGYQLRFAKSKTSEPALPVSSFPSRGAVISGPPSDEGARARYLMAPVAVSSAEDVGQIRKIIGYHSFYDNGNRSVSGVADIIRRRINDSSEVVRRVMTADSGVWIQSGSMEFCLIDKEYLSRLLE
ncbi:MAG: serine/threonine-protein kinase [Fimbriimonadaceae bacterium]|nr:serine/threonine-protein kinase [Fimbriimonadaceae bacterium]